ncbi:MAG: hypothetical protein QOI15_2381 [Pseudonocardiales bacterium]|jgi:hypothetical protein|nr:hypothetical protein [Pseudonocardiales bacterium]MDT4921479.1 hypothetical protein [Pseudonocardiales bacterium]
MTDLVAKHGSANSPDRGPERQRPPGVSDEVVAALGKLSEALEGADHARGMLYGFHQLCGTIDGNVQEAVAMFRSAGMAELADEIEECLVGRAIVDDRWSFQLVEAYDEQYWEVFRDVEQEARARAGVPERHVYEAEMKVAEQQPH